MAIAPSTYESTWRDSQRINWHVDELIGPDKPMDFRLPFLPESLVRAAELDCLTTHEKLMLNHIRANSYLHLFILVEAFIIPMVVDQVKRAGYDNVFATQALLGFAEEEGKHIYMFQEFMAAFEQGFHHPCQCVGPVDAIAQNILAYPPLSVLLLTLQFEWTTQIHYLESIRQREERLDQRFCDLLKYHWMEEAQHTKLDALLVHDLITIMPKDEIETAIAGYFDLVQLLHDTLMIQAQLDIESLIQAINHQPPPTSLRILTDAEKQTLYTSQTQAYCWTFLCAGIAHPNLIQVLETISPNAKEQAIALAKTLSHSNTPLAIPHSNTP